MNEESLDNYLDWLDRNYDEYEMNSLQLNQFEKTKKIVEYCQEKIEYYEKLLAEIKKENVEND